jgi:signal transduction histidine kinase
MDHNAQANSEHQRVPCASERELIDASQRHHGTEAVGRVAWHFVGEIDRLVEDICGLVSDALDRTESHDPRGRDLRSALDCAKRAREVMQQFLAFSRGRLRAPEWLPLADSLETLRPMLEQLTGDSIRLDIEPVPVGLHVNAPPEGLARVLTGLVADAAEALPVGGGVAIRASALSKQGTIVLTVHPSGFGQQPLREPASHDAVVASWDGVLRLAFDDRELLYELTLRATESIGPRMPIGPSDAVRVPSQ